MKSMKEVVAADIDAVFDDTPELRKLLKRMLKESPTPEAFESKLYLLVGRLKGFFCADYYRSNWHSIHCECDECMRLQYGNDACD